MDIQWYPGHMAKTRRMLLENLKLVDIVIELLDARIPHSSRNPDIAVITRSKKRIAVLNKADLADDAANAAWKRHYEGEGYTVVLADSVSGKGLAGITAAARRMMEEKHARMREKGRICTPTRAMILGIPNVGKSTLINSYAGRAAAAAADRPGVTRSKQWIKVKDDFELLDTPGILWHKFDDENVALNLAFTGAINDNVLDAETLSVSLLDAVMRIKPQALEARYKIDIGGRPAHEVFEAIGAARGFKMKGGATDAQRTAVMLLDEFRGAKVGRITLELPPVVSV